MTTAKFNQPDFTTQDATTYKSSIDASIAVLSKFGKSFAPQEQNTPNMTIKVLSGLVLTGGALIVKTDQNSATIAAPSVNPRIDRIVIDSGTGTISVVTGTAASSPVAPAVPAGSYPIAQVLLQTTSTAITNSMITDERITGNIINDFKNLRSTGLSYLATSSRLIIGGTTDNGVDECQINGSIYASGSINSAGTKFGYGNEVWEDATNGPANLWLNYRGYNGGTTQFRTTKIGDGKNNTVATFDGSTKALDVVGKITGGSFMANAVSAPTTAGYGLDPAYAPNASAYCGVSIYDAFANSSYLGVKLNSSGGVALSINNTPRLLINYVGAMKVTTNGSFTDAVGTDRQYSLGHNLFGSFGDALWLVSNADVASTFAGTFASLAASGYLGTHYVAATGPSIVAVIKANGDFQSATNSYGSVSDEKLKNIIGEKKSTWEKCKAYKWIEYYFKSDEAQETKMLGLSAQQAESVSPGVVGENEDYEEETYTEIIEKEVPITQKQIIKVPVVTYELENGNQVETITLTDKEIEIPVFDEYPVVDQNGKPITKMVDGEEIQVTQKIVRTQIIKEPVTKTRKILLGTKTKFVRYSVVTMQHHRTLQEAQFRIEAVEKENRELREALESLIQRVKVLEGNG